MNAKVKLIAAIAAVQLIVPMMFAQSPVYQVTGRVVQMSPSRIVIRGRGPDRPTWVILRGQDRRLWSPVRVGDTVTVDYNMVAVSVTAVSPARPPVVPPRTR